MSESLKKVVSKINIDKEILSTLPINNKKNKKIYLQKLMETKEKYIDYNNEILNKMVEIYDLKTKSEDDNRLFEKAKQIEEISYIENVINSAKTNYEKIGLDKVVYNLKRFYKKNMDIVNEDISKVIEIFKKYNINLTKNDFNFSKYTLKYMEVFFEELDKGDIYSKKLKDTFEEIYWKSPDIIVHLNLNIRYIFLKKEAEINKIISWEKNRVKTRLKVGNDKILERYNLLKKEYIEDVKTKRINIINNFLDGYWNVKDYDEKNIKKVYSKFIDISTLEQNTDEINRNLINLLHNLYEYDMYLRYKFIYDSVKEIYLKEKEKDTYKNIKKTIIKDTNRIILRNRFFKNDKSEKKSNIESTNLVNLYTNLDLLDFEEKVKNKLNNNSSLKEMGEVAISSYKFIFKEMIKKYPDITEEEIKVNISEFKEFVQYPYDTISESILMCEEKNIPLMIKDRYNLFEINLTYEMLNENNLEGLIMDLKKIENYYYIIKSEVDLNEIEQLGKIKKIIKANT